MGVSQPGNRRYSQFKSTVQSIQIDGTVDFNFTLRSIDTVDSIRSILFIMIRLILSDDTADFYYYYTVDFNLILRSIDTVNFYLDTVDLIRSILLMTIRLILSHDTADFYYYYTVDLKLTVQSINTVDF